MKLIDSRNLDSGSLIEGDLCIIGAGAAGIAMARRFIGRLEKVILLESGGQAADQATQDLNGGTVVGQAHAPLAAGRLRGFGGTTQHWTAHVRRLDPLDFEPRPWLADSGWPIDYETLTPHYEAAEALLGLPKRPFDLEAWPQLGAPPSLFGRGRFGPQLRQVALEKLRRFGPRFRHAIAQAKNIQVYLRATVKKIELAESHNQVTGLSVATLTGKTFRVRARRYVLAAGGIENARLLLLSGFTRGAITGEELVGGNFANHPEGWLGYIQPNQRLDLRFFKPRQHAKGTLRPLISLGGDAQQDERLLGCWVQPIPGAQARAVLQGVQRESVNQVAMPRSRLADQDVASLAREMDGHERVPFANARIPTVGLRFVGEPTPNPASRIRLGVGRDALGQPRSELDWRLGEQDSQSVERTLRLLGAEIGASRSGRLRGLFPDDGYSSIRTVASHHHMGTTRMHADPKRGVVDQNCQVHDVSNLFVAGSSVFPTFGTANPTLTILALADRLTDHLINRPWHQRTSG